MYIDKPALWPFYSRQQLLDSKSQLICRCFSTWRKLTTSVFQNASQLFISKLLSSQVTCSASSDTSSDNFDKEDSISALSSSSHTTIAHSRPSVNLSASDRLNYLQELSCQIENNLQRSLHNRDRTTHLKGTSNVVRRLFVENEPLPTEHRCTSNSMASCSQSLSSSHTMCSCLEPQVIQKIWEFQERTANMDLSCDGVFPNYHSNTAHQSNVTQPQHTQVHAHPTDSDNLSSSVSQSSASRGTTANDSTSRLVYSATSCVKNMRLYPCNRAFYQWLALARKKASLREKSTFIVRLFRLRRLENKFELWRGLLTKSVALKSLGKGHQDQVNMQVTRSCFCLWRVRVDQDKQYAAAIERIRRIRRALNRWKKYHQSVTQEKSGKVYTSLTFNYNRPCIDLLCPSILI